ncbi:hypothetical protein RJ639_031230, partial [Escallonia herrerae]
MVLCGWKLLEIALLFASLRHAVDLECQLEAGPWNMHVMKFLKWTGLTICLQQKKICNWVWASYEKSMSTLAALSFCVKLTNKVEPVLYQYSQPKSTRLSSDQDFGFGSIDFSSITSDSKSSVLDLLYSLNEDFESPSGDGSGTCFSSVGLPMSSLRQPTWFGKTILGLCLTNCWTWRQSLSSSTGSVPDEEDYDHPELGFEEHRTGQLIVSKLEVLGVDYTLPVSEQGWWLPSAPLVGHFSLSVLTWMPSLS